MFPLVQKYKNRPRKARVTVKNKVARFFMVHCVHCTVQNINEYCEFEQIKRCCGKQVLRNSFETDILSKLNFLGHNKYNDKT